MDSYFFSKWAYYDRKRAESSYIKDGLVLWLDGIQNSRSGHNSALTKWEDLSGNKYDFTPFDSRTSPDNRRQVLHWL